MQKRYPYWTIPKAISTTAVIWGYLGLAFSLSGCGGRI